jgi:hypothetical protein
MPLVMSERHSTHFDELKKVCALKIKNAKRDDSGLYSIVAENPYGSDDSSGQVTVNVPEQIRPKYKEEPEPIAQAPRIVKPFQPETFINEGQPIVINCVIEGLPLPKVSFSNIKVRCPQR